MVEGAGGMVVAGLVVGGDADDEPGPEDPVHAARPIDAAMSRILDCVAGAMDEGTPVLPGAV